MIDKIWNESVKPDSTFKMNLSYYSLNSETLKSRIFEEMIRKMTKLNKDHINVIDSESTNEFEWARFKSDHFTSMVADVCPQIVPFQNNQF